LIELTDQSYNLPSRFSGIITVRSEFLQFEIGGTYERVWRRARQATFTKEVCASPLAKRPYDLRHAAVSTWLNSGVPAPEVAEWAGHSVAVLLDVYARCLEGGRQGAMNRVEAALGWDSAGWDLGGSLARIWREQLKTAGESRTRPDSSS
jgi:integrase